MSSGSEENRVDEGKDDIALTKNNDNDSADPSEDAAFFPDPDVETSTVLETVSWWAEFTSIHGVYYAFERGHFRAWKQITWLLITMAAAGALMFVLVEEFRGYFEYSINTSVKTIIPNSLSFPQVTVCNHNKYDSSLQNSTGIYEPMNEEQVNAISQPFSDFMLTTEFNQVSYDNLTQVWTPVITSMGRCYSFVTDEQVFKPGVTAGLYAEMWLNQSNYENTTSTAGVDIFVTQAGSAITDQTTPVSVPPGASSIAISLIRYDRTGVQEKPWSGCYGFAPEYSNEVCRADCIDAATREICGCRLLGDSKGPELRYCNSTDDACTSEIGDQAIETCDCSTPPCREDIYISRYSAAGIASKMATRIEEEYDFQRGEMFRNFVLVYINFDSIRLDRVDETKATSAPQLISNLGGNMGFFMGISLISLIEIFGELLGLRIVPRLWGDKRLYGVGQKKFD